MAVHIDRVAGADGRACLGGGSARAEARAGCACAGGDGRLVFGADTGGIAGGVKQGGEAELAGAVPAADPDSQQVKNIGKDIITLAKTLGISENVLKRGRSIEDFAENNEWSTLKEELDATQNEVKLAMDEQQDEELTTLVTLGGWIRGTQAVSGWIASNYTEPEAKLLRQPGILALLRAKLAALPVRTREDDLVKGLDPRLQAIQEMVSFPVTATPTQADVKKLNDAAGELVTNITSKR